MPVHDVKSRGSAPIETSADVNAQSIRELLGAPADLILRELMLGRDGHTVIVCCIDGLVDRTLIDERVLRVLLGISPMEASEFERPGFFERLRERVLPLQETAVLEDRGEALHALLSGDTVLFADGQTQALVLGSRGWKTRPVEEPQTEALIRGPRDGFTEDIRTNSALVRRRVRDGNLRMVSRTVGTRSRKQLIVAYIDGIVNPELVKEVMRRVDTIEMDDVEGSGFVEQWITDNALSPFPQIINTERPDKVSGALMQGRVAILVEGTPFQLILPATFASFIQSPEDYYQNWFISSSLRMLRFIAAYVATFLPALYIALLEYHHGMLPSRLAFSIAASREGVPFPAFIEALLMEATLELLREAGIRLPKPIGQTIGIVGGLVIGEAAVSAGIVSPIMVIIVSLTAISSFALPAYSFAISIRLLRFGVMFAASVFGLYGIVLWYIVISAHLANLSSFGIPYATPLVPTFLKDWKNFLLRAPLMQMRSRPVMLNTVENNRMEGEEEGKP